MADYLGAWLVAGEGGSVSGTVSNTEIYFWSNRSSVTINENTISVIDSQDAGTGTITATPTNDYVFDHWEFIGSASDDPQVIPEGTISDIYAYSWYTPWNAGEGHPSGYPQIRAVFEVSKASQEITLINGHNYIVTSAESVSSATLENNVLTIANTGKIDLMDLGAGSRSGGAIVMLVSPDNVQYVRRVNQ